MLTRASSLTYLATNITETPTMVVKAVRRAKPRAGKVKRDELREDIMKRYEKTLAYLGK